MRNPLLGVTVLGRGRMSGRQDVRSFQGDRTPMRPALPHQPPGLQWVEGHDLAPLLIDRRLGKCKYAIHWAVNRKDCYRVLIVAPLSSIPDWTRELEAEEQVHYVLAGQDSRGRQGMLCMVDDTHPPEDFTQVFCLINPQAIYTRKSSGDCMACGGAAVVGDQVCGNCDGVGKVDSPAGPDFVALYKWDAVIIDESTCIKNPKAITNKVVQNELARAKYRAILTGEVAPEGPLDIFEQMRFVHGHFMGRRKFWPWRDENFRQIGFSWEPRPGHLQKIKEAVAARSYRLTRKEAGIREVTTFERKFCDLPKNMAEAYRVCEQRYRLPPVSSPEAAPGLSAYGHEGKYAIQVASWLAQLAGGYLKGRPDLDSPHKMMVLADLLLGDLRREKVVVTFRFNRELEEAHRFLEKNKINHRVITGSTPIQLRKMSQENFRKPEGFNVLLMQVQVAKFGIDLSAADTMIRYSLPYSYETISQSMDRLVSPAKENVLHYIDLVTRGTVDEDVVEVAQDKQITARFFMTRLESRLIDRLRKAVA